MPKIDFKKELKTFYRPYSEEHENIMKLHRLIEESGGRFDGQVQKHHEIYLSDFRRVAPEKLKTVLRQPFVR